MLKVRHIMLSAMVRHIGFVAGLPAARPLACLLSTAASLLEAAKLLKQQSDGCGEAPSDSEEAASLIAALPSYLSLAWEVFQAHAPTEV